MCSRKIRGIKRAEERQAMKVFLSFEHRLLLTTGAALAKVGDSALLRNVMKHAGGPKRPSGRFLAAARSSRRTL
jgi:hypothetical protein